MNRLVVLALLVFALAAPSAIAADTGLQGLWKVVSLDNLTTGAKEASNRQYHMFSASHHMITLAGEGRPKLSKSFADMTAEEVRSQKLRTEPLK